MKKLTMVFFAGWMSITSIGSVLAEDAGPFAAENFSASLAFTTDYVFRGQSFADEGPAIQGSMDWGYNMFYAGIWGSNLELGDGTIELDYYVGIANSFGPIDWDLMAIYYHFPATAESSVDGVDPDQFETWLTLSHTFADVPFEPTLGVFWAWSPDFTLEDGTSHFVEGQLALSLPYGFGVSGAYGYQDIEGDKTTPTGWNDGGSGLSYETWNFGLSKDIVGFGLDFRYHDTDENSDFIAYWGSADNIEERVVFTISRSF
ncbi:MAG: TorF family putative porin [Proteobacteria bacterium]|nr:TorF family putative porin [Pseudomonadota bacterium]